VRHPPGAWSDEEGLRWYTFQGEDYLSVTSQRKVLGMPYRLHEWVLSQMALGVMAHPMSAVPERGETEDDHRKRLKRFATVKRDAAAERGTEVHALIANGTSLKDVPEAMVPYVESYARAVIALGIQPLLVERQVYSRRFRYAGSFDLLGRIRARGSRSYVVDLKTGSGTYPEHAIQSVSYLRADFVAKEEEVDEQATALLKEADGAAILHVYPATPEDPLGWRFHDIGLTPAIEQAYRAQCVLARWYAHFKDISQLEVNDA
jgi:hypothetical protein